MTEAVEEINSMHTTRTFLSQNQTIKLKIKYLPSFSKFFDNLNNLAKISSPIIKKIYDRINRLESEMGEYVDRPPADPKKHINTQMM